MASRRIPPANVRIKRVYAPPAESDGPRILVDRLWPRGVRKSDARIGLWARDLAPSASLRKWFGHDPVRWNAFRRRYARELKSKADRLEELRSMALHGPITLVFAARDVARNDAVALRELILSGAGKGVEDAT